MEFSVWVREQRIDRGWTQADLAHRVRVNSQTVSRWERAEFLPDLEMFRALCVLFECSADEPLCLPEPPADKGAA